jgi:uncharacterized protein
MATGMASAEQLLKVRVVYLAPGVNFDRLLSLPPGSRAIDAIEASGLLAAHPELSSSLSVGVFGQACAPDHPLRDGDRVEVYRPLTVDPKEARRVRAEVRRRRKSAA